MNGRELCPEQAYQLSRACELARVKLSGLYCNVLTSSNEASYNLNVLALQGYTNADNPFGDQHLLDTFVWSKKLEQEGKKNVPMTEIQKMQKVKLIESKVCVFSGLAPEGNLQFKVSNPTFKKNSM